MELPEAAAANPVGVPKRPGRADSGIFTHRAGAGLPNLLLHPTFSRSPLGETRTGPRMPQRG